MRQGERLLVRCFIVKHQIRLFMRTRNFLVLCYVVKYKILGLLLLSGPLLRELLQVQLLKDETPLKRDGAF